MRQYFVDTWLLIAALDRLDHHHANARRIGAAFGGSELVSHDGIFTEVLAYFSEQGVQGRERAEEAVRNARRRWTVLPTDRDLFDRALDLYSRRPDKEYSLIDCMSMTVMRDHGIQHVLTNDHHFRQEGFTVLSDAP